MARRMGKTADDQYMGGGSGNWSRAPKKKAAVKRKPSGASRSTAEAVKKMKQKESSVPKPRRKPTNETKKGAKSGATYGSPKTKVKTAKGGGSQGGGRAASQGSKTSAAKSGATRGTLGKVDGSLSARFLRGLKRLGTSKTRATAGPSSDFVRSSAGGQRMTESQFRKGRKVTRRGKPRK